VFDFLIAATAVTLSSAPLSQVIAQVKFSAQTVFNSQQGAALFHDLVSDSYPRLLSEQQQTVIAGPGGLTSTSSPQWRLTDLDAAWACVVSAEQVSLETTAYSDWSEMSRRLDEILRALENVTKVRVCERVGLRYVNHISPDEVGSYEGRIEEDLLGPAVRPGWQDALTATLAQSVLQDGNTRLIVRSGTGEGIVDRPGVYVVDIDCFKEAPASYDRQTLMATFADFNDAIYRCFCSCVPESFRATLK